MAATAPGPRNMNRLSPQECARLGNLVGTVDCRRVRIYQGTDGAAGLIRRLVLGISRNRAVSLGNHVFLPDRCRDDLAALAHELTHCGQYQSWGALTYYARGAKAQIKELLHRALRIGSSPYRYEIQTGKPFEAYGIEQQAQIVEDCFRGHSAARAVSPFQPGGSSGQT